MSYRIKSPYGPKHVCPEVKTVARYQCSCGASFTSKAMAMAHAATAKGNHLVKRVQ